MGFVPKHLLQARFFTTSNADNEENGPRNKHIGIVVAGCFTKHAMQVHWSILGR